MSYISDDFSFGGSFSISYDFGFSFDPVSSGSFSAWSTTNTFGISNDAVLGGNNQFTIVDTNNSATYGINNYSYWTDYGSTTYSYTWDDIEVGYDDPLAGTINSYQSDYQFAIDTANFIGSTIANWDQYAIDYDDYYNYNYNFNYTDYTNIVTDFSGTYVNVIPGFDFSAISGARIVDDTTGTPVPAIEQEFANDFNLAANNTDGYPGAAIPLKLDLSSVDNLLDTLFLDEGSLKSKSGIEVIINNALTAKSVLNNFYEQLTGDQRLSLEELASRGNELAEVGRKVFNVMNSGIESLQRININDNEYSPNEMARLIQEGAKALADSLTPQEFQVFKILYPELDTKLGDLQNPELLNNPFAVLDNLRASPYTADTQITPFTNIDAQTQINRAVAAWIAERGTINDEQYDAIANFVLASRAIQAQDNEVRAIGFGEGQANRTQEAVAAPEPVAPQEDPGYFIYIDSGGAGAGAEEGDGGEVPVDEFAIEAADVSSDVDPSVDFTGETATGLLTVPEDQFVETDGGLYVLEEEINNDEIITDDDTTVDSDDPTAYPNGTPYDDDGNLNPGWAINPETGEPYFVGGDYIDPTTIESANASREAFIQSQTKNAQAQAAIQAQRKQANEGDWRVKLRLAAGADYLYKDPELNQDGILWPLNVTDGVVFPYTPQIQTTYGANYNAYDLTHSNYRGYFYQNSYVDEIQVQATFTAQDTSEANYMLAVIHFFKSVTKMFYGQDAQRGMPPPLVFLQGLGEFQFNLHPCVVRTFNYQLPNNVDYIRARSVSVDGTNLLKRRDRQTLSTSPSLLQIQRLLGAGLQTGAVTRPQAPPTLGTNSPTYVPTKIDITLGLLPIQSRSQVSKQFSLKQFANGDLLKGGFW